MNKLLLPVMVVILLIGGVLVVNQFLSTSSGSPEINNEGSSQATSTPSSNQSTGDFVGQKLATNYYEFTQADYKRLREENRPLLLYFYANWCPTCAAQEPVMVEAMNKGVSNGMIALRVNYNDTATDATEKELAREFAITYQHTFVSLDKDGKKLDLVNGQQSEEELRDLFAQL